MKELELYDIITLDDDNEYTILKALNNFNQKYYLIAPIDEEEEPDMENVKIVKEIKVEDRIAIQEETDAEKLKELSKKFLEQLKKELVE